MTPVYRIQDDAGRGPFKPGFSHVWNRKTDAEGWALAGYYRDSLTAQRLRTPGLHYGCACLSPDQLKIWFNPQEYEILRVLGYQAVRLNTHRILITSPVQVVFERRQPLAQGGEPFDLYPLVTANL